jgi:hypothetical protein
MLRCGTIGARSMSAAPDWIAPLLAKIDAAELIRKQFPAADLRTAGDKPSPAQTERPSA